MRKLASIQRILKLEPIEGADAIEKATIEGWVCVVKKGDFQVGGLCCFCEIDSLMPDRPEYEFLKPRNMRVRTIKLKGQISQGLALPLSVLNGLRYESDTRDTPNYNLKEGDDVTSLLGVTKYEPYIPPHMAGLIKGDFPSFLQKSDETRVQILQPMLDEYKGTLCYVTEKLDGSSVTIFLNNGEFGVCSRNLELKETPDNTLWKLAREMDIESKMRKLGRNIALQGECVGDGINKNTLKLKGHKIFFFSIYDIDNSRYIWLIEFKKILYEFGLESVPVINVGLPLPNDIPMLVELSKGKSEINPEGEREGIVIRPIHEIVDIKHQNELAGGRISFKVVNPIYLLKED